METKKIFSQNLKWMLEASNMSEGELSRKIGISQQSVSGYIKGAYMPTLETFAKICEVLDVRADFLLGFSVNNYPHIYGYNINHNHEFILNGEL